MHLQTVLSFDDIENPIEKEDRRLLALGKSKIEKSHAISAHVENQKRRIRERRAKNLINNDNQAADKLNIG